MSLFSDVVSNIKKVVMTDDEGFLNDENGFYEEEKKGLFSGVKRNNDKKPSFPDFSNQKFDINGLDYDRAKQNQSVKRMANGRIQVYAPKNFDEAFDIIKNVENGSTAMVNVETTNQQSAMRIIDCISGAMFALNGQCKKIGEKQYIFTLNAELSGAIDYLPGQGNPYNYKEPQYQNFNMQNPFTFQNNQSQGYGYNQPNTNQYQNNNQQMYNNQLQYGNQNYQQGYDYIKPQNQF